MVEYSRLKDSSALHAMYSLNINLLLLLLLLLLLQSFYSSSGFCPGQPGWACTRKVKPGR